MTRMGEKLGLFRFLLLLDCLDIYFVIWKIFLIFCVFRGYFKVFRYRVYKGEELAIGRFLREVRFINLIEDGIWVKFDICIYFINIYGK